MVSIRGRERSWETVVICQILIAFMSGRTVAYHTVGHRVLESGTIGGGSRAVLGRHDCLGLEMGRPMAIFRYAVVLERQSSRMKERDHTGLDRKEETAADAEFRSE